jgi:hypothetical protein
VTAFYVLGQPHQPVENEALPEINAANSGGVYASSITRSDELRIFYLN